LDLQRASGDHSVAVTLRQEVGFACPICACPILTFHHFDPPWREREHNDVEGMIALCRRCHDKAEGGAWTKSELREFKRQPHPRRPAPENLMWTVRQKVLYRLGANYLTTEGGEILRLGGRRILWQDRTLDGRLLFSFDLLGEDGGTLIRVRQNSLSVDDVRVWDMRLNTLGNHLTVQPFRGCIALDLRLRRLTDGDLRSMVSDDFGLANRKARKGRRTDDPADGRLKNASRINNFVERLLQSVTRECLDEDGRVPMISFEKAALRGSGNRSLEINGRGFTDASGNKFESCIFLGAVFDF
jgi:hypothetical protein